MVPICHRTIRRAGDHNNIIQLMPVTGKRTDIKRYEKTKTEALKGKREILNKLE
jgi:hypothetical protein